MKKSAINSARAAKRTKPRAKKAILSRLIISRRPFTHVASEAKETSTKVKFGTNERTNEVTKKHNGYITYALVAFGTELHV